MKPIFGETSPPPLLVALLATAAMAWAGHPATSGWWAVAAGIGLWWLVWILPTKRTMLLVVLILIPIPATGFAGLRTLDPALWALLAVAWSGLYALIGTLFANLAQRWAPRLATPIPWLFGWSGVDHLLVHALPLPLPAPLALGYVVSDTALVSLAALTGPAGLGLAASVLSLAVVALLRTVIRRDIASWHTAQRLLCAATLLVSLALLLPPLAARTPALPARNVAISQLPLGSPTPGGPLANFIARASELDADLHIWPEAALLDQTTADLPTIARAAEALAATLLAGAMRTAADGRLLNSAVVADRHTVRFAYDKERLVPHFEAHVSPGIGERWPIRWAGWPIGLLICWESLYYDLALQRVHAGAEVLVVLAHAGWAGESTSGHWHAQVARVLASSLGLPVIFAAHEGPSMAWGHDGRLIGALPRGAEALVLPLAPPLAWRTPYRVLGPHGVTLMWWCGLAVALMWARLPPPGRLDHVP